jgi:hypothetical protein
MAVARGFLGAVRRGESLGEALNTAKRGAWPGGRRIAVMFNLLGDPAGR